MSQRDVAFALELVARAIERHTWTYGPEKMTQEAMGNVARELTEYAEILKAAPVSDGFVWCASVDDGPCTFHPLGGPDCAM